MGRNGFVKPAHAMFRNMTQTVLQHSIKHKSCSCYCHTAMGVDGGGVLSFFLHTYIGSGPASTVHPQKHIRNFKHPQKIVEILATQKISLILYVDLKKKTLKNV